MLESRKILTVVQQDIGYRVDRIRYSILVLIYSGQKLLDLTTYILIFSRKY